MDSVPRLLAAMQFIACNELRASGSFEVVGQIVRTKQLIATRTTVSAGSNGHGTINQYVDTNVNVQLYANLLCEALSIHDDAASIISKNRFDESKGYSIEHVLQSMRRLSRDDAAKELKKIPKAKLGSSSIRDILDALYAIPLLLSARTEVLHSIDKESGKSVGTLRLKMDIEFQGSRSTRNDADDFATFVVVVGTRTERILLAHLEFSVRRSGKIAIIENELNFDWNIANADAGEGSGLVVLRILQDRVRGMDTEMEIKLR